MRNFAIFRVFSANSKLRKNIFCEQKENKLPVSKGFLEKFPTFHLPRSGPKRRPEQSPGLCFLTGHSYAAVFPALPSIVFSLAAGLPEPTLTLICFGFASAFLANWIFSTPLS